MNPADSLRAAHCEQSSCNSCLAACIAMVRIRTGEILDSDASAHEQMLMHKLGATAKGLIPEVAAVELGSRLIQADPDVPGSLIVVKGDVLSLRWWHIVMLHPGPLIDLRRRQLPRPESRHGELVVPMPHHAVTLVGVEGDRFLYLDPWFSRAFQPQSMSIGEFAGAWTGRYIPVRLP